MKRNLIYILLIFSFAIKAQQTITYTQYLFNKAGINPAASGTDINQKYNYVFGINRQWTDINNSPKATFANFSYTIRPPRSYRFWQNVGVYVDNDQSGLFTNTGVYGNYTLHMLIRRRLVASFGIYAGARRYNRSLGGFDQNDPAIQKATTSVLLYPDLIPGFRLSGKKFFTDISIRQLTTPQLKDFKGHRIGTPSKLRPSFYLDYGRKVALADNLLMIPSVALNMQAFGAPSVDVNAMFYYATRIGAGVSIRNTSFASATLQIRFLENITAGFSYSYPLNSMRYAARNSFEIMVGVTPIGMNSVTVGKHSIAKCPTLDF